MLAIASLYHHVEHKTKTKNAMFTLDQIKQAHSKVKSGADFPSYISDLRLLGVLFYETYVEDGHTDYFGENSFKTTSSAKYDSLAISKVCDDQQFKSDLLNHQQGKTNYPAFCNDCAKSGIEKWAVSIGSMTCTYFDKNERQILVEEIPS